MPRSSRGLCLWLSLAWILVSVPAGASDSGEPDYALDLVPRTLPERAPLPCEAAAIPLVAYAGERLRFQKPAQVHPSFREPLRVLEQIVERVALEHYGRAPTRIVHLGGYNCRRMRRYPTWVSEHALGNAIDIAGFDFGPLPRGTGQAALKPGAPRRGFQVRLETHWNARGAQAIHRDFLRALAEALIARPDAFPVVLGPAWPGHKNHFHLDHAPYRVVEVF